MALATMRPPGDPRSWVYLFEGEESESIQRTHFSIAHFIYTDALVSDEVDDTLFGDHDDRCWFQKLWPHPFRKIWLPVEGSQGWWFKT